MALRFESCDLKSLRTGGDSNRCEPRRHAAFITCMEFYNGDWGSEEICHHCSGPMCCFDAKSSQRKGLQILRQLLHHLQPQMFSRSNWVSWTKTLRWFGFATTFHKGVVVEAFNLALSKHEHASIGEIGSAEVCAELLEADYGLNRERPMAGEEAAEADQVREENARSLRAALEFLKPDTVQVMQQIWLLRVPLEAERVLMMRLTHSVSNAWNEAQWRAMWETGARQFRPLLLHQGLHLTEFMHTIMSQYCDATIWRPFIQSEVFASELFRLSFRSAAVIYQSVVLRTRHLPYKLFSLLERDSGLERRAEELLQEPACMMDGFSTKFLRHYSDVRSLVSNEAYHVLYSIATLWASTTFHTERLHARNLRRAKARSMTKKVQVGDVALPHTAFQEPGFARENVVQDTVPRKIGRPRKRAASPQRAVDVKRRRAGGGAWRAFLNHQLGGRKFDASLVHELQMQYRQLSPTSRRHYESVGRAGTKWAPASFRLFQTRPPLPSKTPPSQSQMKPWA